MKICLEPAIYADNRALAYPKHIKAGFILKRQIATNAQWPSIYCKF